MKYLLVGCPKTGNTWCRFVIFNYWNIKENDAKKTLTYNDLIGINKEIWDGSIKYPQVYFSHLPANGRDIFGIRKDKHYEIYNIVDNIIYIIRNPFDTMISYFHYMYDRDNPYNGRFSEEETKEMDNLKGFTKRFLPYYINHVKSTMNLADVIVKYERVKQNNDDFYNALKLVFGKIDLEIANKAIEMSSFNNIKKMGVDTKREFGLSAAYRGSFTRDGRVGQYKEIMNDDLYEYIKNKCIENGVNLNGI